MNGLKNEKKKKNRNRINIYNYRDNGSVFSDNNKKKTRG